MIDATIAGMTKPYRPGVESRRAILLELRRRELAGEPAPTALALASTLGMSRSSANRFILSMAEWGWMTTRAGRNGGVFLTDEGRIAAG